MSAIVEKVRDLISKGHLDYAMLDLVIELDARVKELEARLPNHEPFPGDNMFGPVLNDGKGRFDPDTHLPFVTGLSKAKPIPDIYCSFCGGEHEVRNLFPGVNATICRSCIVAAERWKADDAQPTPTDEELVDKLISEYLFLFNARFDLDVKDSEDVRDILRQLIRKDRIVL